MFEVNGAKLDFKYNPNCGELGEVERLYKRILKEMNESVNIKHFNFITHLCNLQLPKIIVRLHLKYNFRNYENLINIKCINFKTCQDILTFDTI